MDKIVLWLRALTCKLTEQVQVSLITDVISDIIQVICFLSLKRKHKIRINVS
jgi:hypothetical protein